MHAEPQSAKIVTSTRRSEESPNMPAADSVCDDRRQTIAVLFVLTSGCATHATQSAQPNDEELLQRPPVAVQGSEADKPPVASASSNIVSIDHGEGFGCALHRDGKVSCFGDNRLGQVGTRFTSGRCDAAVVEDMVADALEVAADYACAIHRGSVSCWGGHPERGSRRGVTRIALDDVTQLALGDTHACALLQNGRVACWGSGRDGKLGATDTASSPTPVLVSGVSGATRVWSFAGRSCAAVADGTVCWGAIRDLLDGPPNGWVFGPTKVARLPETERRETGEEATVLPQDIDALPAKEACAHVDEDGDGIEDRDDKCPSESETFNGVDDTDGCPDKGDALVELVIDKRIIKLHRKIEFDFGRRTIKRSSYPVLDHLAALLMVNTFIRLVEIQGHITPPKEVYGRDLSQDRATSVMRYLTRKGVARARLRAKGYGGSMPLMDNRTAEGRAANRRIEIVIRQLR